jgi:hypothetical protein
MMFWYHVNLNSGRIEDAIQWCYNQIGGGRPGFGMDRYWDCTEEYTHEFDSYYYVFRFLAAQDAMRFKLVFR